MDDECGKWDVWKKGGEGLDGRMIVEKGLSGIGGGEEEMGRGSLIEMVKGYGSEEMMEKGYEKVKR